MSLISFKSLDLSRRCSKKINRLEVFYEKIDLISKGTIPKIRIFMVGVFSLFSAVLLIISIFYAISLFLSISLYDYMNVITAALYSVLRTSAALLIAALWTVPLGVYIGMNPKASRILQPIVQVIASVPATAVFPVILLFLIKIGGGLAIGSVLLMLLGTQWYILFNVIAGASAIPQDLKEIAKIYGLKGRMKWKILIIPAIFPYLVTGFITATGGAWNATIVSEYVTFGGEVMKTKGLGSLISESSVKGDFGLLLVSTVMMSIIVVSINRLVWKRMFALAQEKYRLD